ncbi:MAG: hypothetical protein LN414_00325 [Candidatus Thermoplasmatota archaeon]|nr:hypothetical protein [Candidatus Thermoplasmatota archaeon]
MNPSEDKGKYCGEHASQFLFAQFVCEKDECISKARDERGGPGGHMLEKDRHMGGIAGAMDFDEELD